MLRFTLVLFASISMVASFLPQLQPSQQQQKSTRPMVKFEDGQWEPESPEEGPEAGYDATKSLLMHGPKPFLNRIFQADEYNQGVYKLMARENYTRDEAQGNMDAYLRNPNDWAYNRAQEEKTGKKINYSVLKKDKAVLTLVWSGVVVWFVYDVARVILEGGTF